MSADSSGTAIVNKPRTRPQRIPNSVWAEVRQAYANGQGSCKQLAERFGINCWAVSSRCRRQGWRAGQAKLEQELHKRAGEHLDKEAQSLAERASSFLERSVTEGFAWLDQVEKARRLLDAGDIPALRDLVGCWKSLIEVSRRTFRLDDTPTRPGVDLQVLNRPFVVVEVKAPPPAEPREPPKLIGGASSKAEGEPSSSET